MKLEEMADLLDGLATFLDRFGTKGALNDVHAVSQCFRAFPGESVSAFCTAVVKAKIGKPAKSAAGAIDATKVDEAVTAIHDFLDHRGDYDYAHIDRMLEAVAKLKTAEIKVIGERIGCPLAAKTKGVMLSTLQNWLASILQSHRQSSFNLNTAASS